jgi:hypothetical protein
LISKVTSEDNKKILYALADIHKRELALYGIGAHDV